MNTPLHSRLLRFHIERAFALADESGDSVLAALLAKCAVLTADTAAPVAQTDVVHPTGSSAFDRLVDAIHKGTTQPVEGAS